MLPMKIVRQKILLLSSVILIDINKFNNAKYFMMLNILFHPLLDEKITNYQNVFRYTGYFDTNIFPNQLVQFSSF